MAVLKCPNPSCPFLFDPTQVPAGALLTCPRCGMRFTLGPTPTAAAPTLVYSQPAYPAASPTVSIPPQAPAHEPAVNEPDKIAIRPSEPAPHRSHSTDTPRGSPLGPIILVLGGTLLLLGLVGAVIFIVIWARRSSTDIEPVQAGTELVVPDKNFAFRKPGLPWADDAEARADLGVTVLAMRRNAEPRAWVALSVSDYESRSPMPHELRARMLEHLGRMLLNLPPELPVEEGTWAGQKCLKCLFRGEHKATGEVLVGEAHLLSHRGLGYWFYAWAPERDAASVADELAAVRGRFRLLNERPNWTERLGSEIVYRPPNGRYRLSNYEKVWERPKGLQPTDEDPKAELLLKAELKGKTRRDFLPQATLVALSLDRTGSPSETANQYIRKRYTRDPEVFGPTQITEITSEPVGDPAIGPDNAAPAPVTRLKVSPGGASASKSAEKLVVYSVIDTGDGVVVAEGSCPWSQREIWERRLIQLVGSLRK